MPKNNSKFQATSTLSGTTQLFWVLLQGLFLVLGLGIFVALILAPELGIKAFWNVLIPLAPLLFVLVVGLWRNVCPLAGIALLPHRLGFSQRKRIPLKWQDRLNLANVCLLFLIVPARHLSLNVDGLATALLLALLACIAFVGGIFFDAKSLWCSGLCPIHPVEKLYGQKVLFSPPNAHCGACHNCVIPCPDSTPIAELNCSPKTRKLQQLAATLLTGCLPGFIWGWFQVPDCRNSTGWMECVWAYALPWGSMGLTLLLFLGLRRVLPRSSWGTLVNVFAAAAISCYYWFRIPALVGYGMYPQDGLLFDLRHSLPYWIVLVAQLSALAFFSWWLVLRNPAPAVWALRPPFLVKR